MNSDTFTWVFERCEIFDQKVQVKLRQLAKNLNMSEWEILIFLEPLPDVSPYFLNGLIKVYILFKNCLKIKMPNQPTRESERLRGKKHKNLP